MTKSFYWSAAARLLCVLSFASLALPMFYTYLEYAAAFGERFVNGFGLIEFSAAGVIPIVAPFILLLLLLGKGSFFKTLCGVIIITLMNAGSFCIAIIVLASRTTGPMRWMLCFEYGLWIYCAFTVLAAVAVCVSAHLRFRQQQPE